MQDLAITFLFPEVALCLQQVVFGQKQTDQHNLIYLEKKLLVSDNESDMFRPSAGDHQVIPMTVHITICVFTRIAGW